ncbi:hypothetical protein [Heyndrickxia oleronia]|uniref:hypothetical protein n=1 Tax=Heyndrickxia oleronia TaxID=38875 RepID=UPI001C0E9B6F|nr:hypothetical protein [Heyndrickxia oleronia]MBU5211056.1 hypothetical protein [Heyndrickxia oleronia]
MDLKLRLFEEVLFEIKDGSTEQTFVPKHPKLRRTVFGLIHTLSTIGSYKELELLNSAVGIAWEALDSFELAEGADWTDVIEGRDRHNLNRVVKAIIAKLEHELVAEANPNTHRMYDPLTGGKQYVTINFDSLDRPIYDENGEVVGTLGDEVSESYFAPKPQTYANPFVEWFRENRHEFLTRRQNEFIDGLSTGLQSKESDYVDVNDFEQLAGMQRNDLDHMKKRIRDRTLKAWEQHKAGKPELTRRGAYLIGKIAELNEFIAIAESDDDLPTQNQRLSAWLKSKELEHAEDPTDLISVVLAGDITATKAFANFMNGETKTIDSAVLYRIYDAIKTKVDRLKREIARLATAVEPRPIDYEKRARNAERKRKYEDFKREQPCKVYNKDGELVRTMTSNMKEYKVVELNAFGMTYDLREN